MSCKAPFGLDVSCWTTSLSGKIIPTFPSVEICLLHTSCWVTDLEATPPKSLPGQTWVIDPKQCGPVNK